MGTSASRTAMRMGEGAMVGGDEVWGGVEWGGGWVG